MLRREKRGAAAPFVGPVGRLGCALVLALTLFSTAAAQASWGPGPKHCSRGEGHHCYALDYRNITQFGGVLASIDFVDTLSADVEGESGRVSNEQWISFPNTRGEDEWIETGQVAGNPYGCCEEHPFYAEMLNGTYHEHLSEGTVPLNTYNHYVLFDPEENGRWHIYWLCCEVGSYGGGWPAYLTEQEAGIEAGTETRPTESGRQEVAASDGGEWGAWGGAQLYREPPGICAAVNPESSAAGNIAWSTHGPESNPECK